MRFKTCDLIGYFLHERHQIIPVANVNARFKSCFAKTEVLNTFLCVFFVFDWVACNLRFNVRVFEGSGKKVDKRYKSGYSAKYCKWFAKIWK